MHRCSSLVLVCALSVLAIARAAAAADLSRGRAASSATATNCWTVGTLPAGVANVLTTPPAVRNTIAAGRVVPFNALAIDANGLAVAARASVRVRAP